MLAGYQRNSSRATPVGNRFCNSHLSQFIEHSTRAFGSRARAMEHTVAAPSRARGYQSGTSRHIERADPEMVRLDACPPLPPRAIGPVAWASTGIFSARAGNAAGPPRVHVHRPSSRAKSARGLRETFRLGPDRPRPPPTAPGPARGRDAPPLTPRRAHRTHHLPRTLPRGRRRSRRRARPPTDRRPGR